MKAPRKRFPPKLFIFFVLMIASLLLAACASTTSESISSTIDDQQTETNTKILIPVIESSGQENSDAAGENQAYPDPEQEFQAADTAESQQTEAYPEPEVETLAQTKVGTPQDEAYPDPQEESILEPKPTPRGNELVATNPSTVKLASGQLQLVELFAFW